MNLVRAQYIRFKNAVMGPGRAQSTITKAYLTQTATTPSHEVMDEIIVGDFWVILRAKRKTADGKEYLAERMVRASNVVDCEPVYDDEPVKKKEKAA